MEAEPDHEDAQQQDLKEASEEEAPVPPTRRGPSSRARKPSSRRVSRSKAKRGATARRIPEPVSEEDEIEKVDLEHVPSAPKRSKAPPPEDEGEEEEVAEADAPSGRRG